MKLRKLLAFLLAATLVLGISPLSSLPDWLSSPFDVDASALDCGPNLTWTLTGTPGQHDSCLDITGSGAMYNYTSTTMPWYSDRNEIAAVIINGATNIGDWAFAGCTNLASVLFNCSVTSIGNGSFFGCTSLTSTQMAGHMYSGTLVSIGYMAYEGCTGLTSIDLPLSVTSIGNRAFFACTNATSVNIPTGLITLGSDAFSDCYKIAGNIILPATLTGIGDGAFFRCDSVTSYTVNGANLYYSNDSYGVLFNDDYTTLIQYPIGNTRTSYDIPSTVTSIYKYAFYGANKLETVNVPSSVTSIGEYAFGVCQALTTTNIPSGVTSIQNGTYYNCTSLPTITIPSGVTSIGAAAFGACTSLTGIVLPSGVTSIGTDAFHSCSSLVYVHIPTSVTTIGSGAFTSNNAYICNIASCNAETYANSNSIPFHICNGTHGTFVAVNGVRVSPSSVTIMQGQTTQLTATVVPYNASIQSVAWASDKTSVATVSNSGLVTGVSPGTAYITAPSTGGSLTQSCTVTVIQRSYSGQCGDYLNYSFDMLTGLLQITGTGAMYDFVGNPGDPTVHAVAPWYNFRSSITDVTIDPGATSIGSAAFMDCRSLKSVIMDTGVASIGDKAFDGCTALQYVHIPTSVSAIGPSAFLGTNAYICSEQVGSFAINYARQNSIAYQICAGHGSSSVTVSVGTVSVTFPSGTFANPVNLRAYPIATGNYSISVPGSSIIDCYDIYLVEATNNQPAVPLAPTSFIVRLPIPQAYLAQPSFDIMHVHGGQQTLITAMNCGDGYMQFTTDSFSEFYVCVPDTTVPVEPTGPEVASATIPAALNGVINCGDTQTVVITTALDVTRIALRKYSENRETFSTVIYSPNTTNCSVTIDAANGKQIWTINCRFTYTESVLTKQETWEVWYRVNDDYVWYQSEQALNLTINRYAPAQTDPVEEFKVLSASAPLATKKATSTQIVVVTTPNIKKIRLNLGGAGAKVSTFTPTSTNLVMGEDVNGNLIWTINYKFGTLGVQDWVVQGYGKAWTDIGASPTININVCATQAEVDQING